MIPIKQPELVNPTFMQKTASTAPTLTDLRARVDAVKKANMLQKPALAEQALESFMQYLAAQDARIEELERMVANGKG